MRTRLATSRLLWLSVSIAFGIGLLVTNQLLAARAATWQRAQAANANLLFTVSHVLERTLRGVDLSIRHTVRQLNGLPDEVPFSRLPNETFFRAVPEDGVGLQLVLDDVGRVIRSSYALRSEQWSFADREFFLVHRDNSDTDLFVSGPFQSRQDGEASIALSRRWEKRDGSFGGVVVQAVKLNVLQQLFSEITLGPDSGINLFLTDGTIIMRFPYTGANTGKSLAGTPNFERFIQERNGSFTGVAALDNVQRLYTFRALQDYPLLVNTAQSTDSILGAWRKNALWLGAATLVLMLACVVLAVLAERELRAHRLTSARLYRAENDIRTVVDSLPVMVAYWSDKLTNRFSNLAHQRWFDQTPQQIQGQHMRDVIGKDLFEQTQPYIDHTLGGNTQIFELSFPDATGELRHTVSTFIPDVVDGRVCGFFVLVSDISDLKAVENSLSEEKERFRVTLESIKDGVITTDDNGCVTYQNPAGSQITGWLLDQTLGRPVEDVVKFERLDGGTVPDSNSVRLALARNPNAKSGAELVLVSRTGERTHIEDSAAPIVDGQGALLGAVMVFHEVGHARAMAREMSHLAQHDALTGLPNRRLLKQLVNQALSRASRHGRHVALLYLDLDGFKKVNDTFGHVFGDELLIAVTRRLADTLRAGDTLSRNGGDEFVVLMDGFDDPGEAGKLAGRLIESCRHPIMVSGRAITITVSIGISLYPRDAAEFNELLQLADKAMYSVKAAGRDQYAYFDFHREAEEERVTRNS